MPDSKLSKSLATSYRILAAGANTCFELRRKLRHKGYPEDVVEETVELLKKDRFLNDQDVAKGLINRFRYSQPSGRQKIAFELKKRGVPADISEPLLEELSFEDEEEMGRDVGLRKWNALGGADLQKKKKNVYDFLIRRGFNFQTVRDLVEEFSSSENTND